MKKIKWNLIWNVINGLSVLYLTFLAIMYLAVCLIDGFVDTAKSCDLSDGFLFIAMMAIWIVLIKPVGEKVVDQLLKARENIEDRYTKQKKAAVKSANK